jgi:hypothetical protein
VHLAADIGREDDELVTPDARDGVHGPKSRGQLLGDPLQRSVSRGMPLGVVELLELVEVDEEDSDALAGALGVRKSLVDAVDQDGAVWQTGQRVMCRLLGQRSLRALQVGHPLSLNLAETRDLAVLGLVRGEVGERQAGEIVGLGIDDEGRASDLDGDDDALGVHKIELDGRAEPVRTSELCQPELDPSVHERRQRRSDNRLARARQHLGQPSIGVHDESARRERRRSVAHVLDEHAVRPISGRQRAHARAGPAVGDDKRIDLAGADRSQGVLRLRYAGPDIRSCGGRRVCAICRSDDDDKRRIDRLGKTGRGLRLRLGGRPGGQ